MSTSILSVGGPLLEIYLHFSEMERAKVTHFAIHFVPVGVVAGLPGEERAGWGKKKHEVDNFPHALEGIDISLTY